jgi:hypothetical protein
MNVTNVMLAHASGSAAPDVLQNVASSRPFRIHALHRANPVHGFLSVLIEFNGQGVWVEPVESSRSIPDGRSHAELDLRQGNKGATGVQNLR